MQKKQDANRYVLLTETGLSRLHAIRRRYKTTVDDIIGDINTPSVNTVKRVLRREPVFVSTLERLWDYFQRRAAEKGENLPYLLESKDYVFVEGTSRTDHTDKGDKKDQAKPSPPEQKQGWISRQVPRSNRLFTGRREALDRLHAALKTGPAALIADPQALTGLGGIGKTQTALAYIYEHRREYDYLFWVSAETVETLNEGMSTLAEELKLLTAARATKQQALDRMHDWFRTQSDWLLVLDNVDDLETLAPYFPRHHTGHLLLTTRARNTVKWAAPINLVKFGQEEGALLLLRRAGMAGVDQALDTIPMDVAQAARNLCEELDGLPLALDQAGAYLAETASSVTEYHTLYRQHGLQLLDSTTEPEHASVTVTFTLALEQIAQRSLYGKAAVEMVRLCAFLSPDAIAEAIFLSYPFEQSEAASPLEGQNLFEAIYAAVCGYSLATWNPNSKTVSIHRMVQKVTRDAMSAQERRLWVGRTVQAVSDATPDFEYEDWSLCDLLLPQWRLCREYIQEENIETVPSAYLLYQSGRYLRARAMHAESETCLQRAAAIAENVHGLRHQTTADYLDELACLYRVLDRREEAESLHARAVEIMEQVAGVDHFFTASKLHNMALLYIQYEEYARAEIIFSRALAIYEKQPSPDYLLIATTLTQLAGVYRNQGAFDKAEVYCQRALETYGSLLEPDHIYIATACNNLALLYLTMSRYGDAEEFYLKALKINEQARGQKHPETGTVLWGLARVRWKQRRIEEADTLFRRAIGIYTQHFGREHSLSAKILGIYAQFQQETNFAS
jgi:tetratricopeptide (TPR) repeat protein